MQVNFVYNDFTYESTIHQESGFARWTLQIDQVDNNSDSREQICDTIGHDSETDAILYAYSIIQNERKQEV